MFGLDESPVDLQKLTASISKNEGLRLFPYTDTTGHISIGFGTNLSAGITNAEAAYLRDNRIQLAIGAAQKEPCWAHISGNDARSRAICEIIFNMGIGGLHTFTSALAALCNDDFETAANQFMQSKWYAQVGNRAAVLCEMIRTGKDLA